MDNAAVRGLEGAAKLLLHFTDQIRRDATRYMSPTKGDNRTVTAPKEPLQQAYEACLARLSDAERDALVRILQKMSGSLDDGIRAHSHQKRANEYRSLSALSFGLRLRSWGESRPLG